MMTEIFTSIEIDAIRVPEDRARAFDRDGAAALAGLIEAQGLLHPITVRPHFASTEEKPLYLLVAGLHRLRALEQLGRSVIPARVVVERTNDEARLDEVLENLGRNELTALDRAQHLYELKVVWERMHPETKAGVAGGKARQGTASEIFSFAESTAEKIGLSKRAIQIAVKIWTGLTPASRLRLIGTDLACKQTELKALSEQKPALQAKILELIEDDGRPAIQNVAQALAHLEGTLPMTAVERMVRTLRTGLKELPDASFDLLVVENEERIIASLKRAGRI